IGIGFAVVFLVGSFSAPLYDAPQPFLIPNGIILLVVGLLYLGVSILICSEDQFTVLFRRELASFFYSPIAYIVFIGQALI
ncbi:hypothetical protein ACJENL_27610, partial [Escherichia coli]